MSCKALKHGCGSHLRFAGTHLFASYAKAVNRISIASIDFPVLNTTGDAGNGQE
jgi:hypothetical protein